MQKYSLVMNDPATSRQSDGCVQRPTKPPANQGRLITLTVDFESASIFHSPSRKMVSQDPMQGKCTSLMLTPVSSSRCEMKVEANRLDMLSERPRNGSLRIDPNAVPSSLNFI